MGLENAALGETHDLPIRHVGEVHNGKVRSVYWLSEQDSARLVGKRLYNILCGVPLGVMVISDRISAFDVRWQGEEGLKGVPGKGAALNAVSAHWFNRFEKEGIGNSHLLDVPHPLVWIVQKAQPIMIEAIARKYITGSMWRDYKNGQRTFGGVTFDGGLREHQKLDEILITPSTKGILRGIPGVPEEEDVNITRRQIRDNYRVFGFAAVKDIARYEQQLLAGFELISRESESVGEILVDTKFEFGYVEDTSGKRVMIFIDEAATPDSSRYWPATKYARGIVVENSKEGFREYLMRKHGKPIFIDKGKMPERKALTATYRVPVAQMMEVSQTYRDIAEILTGNPVPKVENPREEILDALTSFGIVE